MYFIAQNMNIMKTILIFLLVFGSLSSYCQNNTCPCCTEDHKKFDFWVGEWEVTNNGKFAGTNTIQYSQDNCVLLENWTGAGPYTGTSMNYYDPVDKSWNQLWLDNQGGSLKLKGQFDGTSMVLMSVPAITPNNGLNIQKITWTPLENGDVRQWWESSDDGGRSWKTLFNGIYSRK